MFQLDDKFLEEVGLGGLPAEQRQAFLQHIYNELELRVGTRLSDGLSDEQLEEFQSIVNKDGELISKWISSHAPEYKQDEAFKRLQQVSGLPEDDQRLRDEYVATKWLEVNRPDYREVVKATLDELKNEISSRKDDILAGATAPVAPDSDQPSDNLPA